MKGIRIGSVSGIVALFIGTGVGLPIAAQTNTATITGVVSDASEAAVAGAAITVTNKGTGIARSTVSDAAGSFVVPDLAPGEYTVTAKHAGFRTYVRSGVLLHVDQRAKLDVRLQVGEVTQEVAVTATLTMTEPQNANVGGLVDQTMTQQLPLNGRQFLQLATMLPGISVNAGGQVTGRGAGPRNFGIQLLGSRPTDNTYLIDGATHSPSSSRTQVCVRQSVRCRNSMSCRTPMMSNTGSPPARR